MRYRYLVDFRRGISVFAIFSYGIAVLGTPQCPPLEDNTEKTLRKNLTATPFTYINNASVDLNEVCLHITCLFLKELVFVIAVFLLALLSHENLHSFPEVVSLF